MFVGVKEGGLKLAPKPGAASRVPTHRGGERECDAGLRARHKFAALATT